MLIRLNGMIRIDQKEKLEALKKAGRSESAIIRDSLDFYFNHTPEGCSDTIKKVIS